jgi:hypothetical protein
VSSKLFSAVLTGATKVSIKNIIDSVFTLESFQCKARLASLKLLNDSLKNKDEVYIRLSFFALSQIYDWNFPAVSQNRQKKFSCRKLSLIDNTLFTSDSLLLLWNFHR